jgi:hypothetical protein
LSATMPLKRFNDLALLHNVALALLMWRSLF